MSTVTVKISGGLITKILTEGYSVNKKIKVTKGIPQKYVLAAITYDAQEDVATLHFNHKDSEVGVYTFGEVSDIEVMETECPQ